jgi:uncharacterized membrane-anchored protein
MLKRLRRDRSKRDADTPGLVTGRARVDKRTKDLVVRLQPGEIAVIDHEDIDRVSAEGLVQRKVKAVVNASRSSTGRYPNLGPLLLCSAGLHVVDDAGPGVMDIPEGARVVIDGDHVYRVNGSGRVEVGKGRILTLEEAEQKLDEAKTSISTELDKFAENTIEYIKDERDVLLEAARLPTVETEFTGRHVLIVVRGYDYKQDLGALHAYIREVRPLLIGVDGGADAILEAGLKPHMIIGDMDSVTTEALLSGAELVVHAYSDGLAPGLERIEALGLDCVTFQATGTSEDIAMLLAFERGAELIVAVGTHTNLIEFLDKGRKGMASTFLVRLRVGTILVDAKGVGRLYKGRVRRSDLMLFIVAALITMGIVLSVADAWRIDLSIYWEQFRDWLFSLREAIFG